ncbi:MAG: hypothetical protein OEM67_04150 [Thermoleophilia bacterium]|nr:hypothetical protein [Thermoleophilia bacterium]MDH3725191.1 hypothetical protein [Thermoleophilia bacterium]
MEMSHEYLRETVRVMQGSGFELASPASSSRSGGGPGYESSRYELTRGDAEHLVLECLEYPDASETYWLELRKVHTIRSFSFQLDSWKHGEAQVEFRYYPRADGVALTFVLAL